MAIKNSVSNDLLSTFADSISIFDCRLPVVYLVYHAVPHLESIDLPNIIKISISKASGLK